MPKLPKPAPREQAPEGTHPAVCVQIVDFGTQASKVEKYGDTHWVQFGFELVEERTTDNKPMVQYRRYNYINTPKSSLAKMLKAWMNPKDMDSFDLEDCLGAPAMVTIEHNESGDGRTYANIVSVTSAPKSMKVKKHSEPLVSLFLDESFDQDVFDGLPEFMRNQIMDSPEYKELQEASKPKAKSAAKKAAPKGRKK